MAQLIYGKNTVYSALEESKVKKLFLQSNFSDSKMLALIKKNNVPYTYKNSSELSKMSKGGNHQGVIAEIEDYSYVGLNELILKAKKKEYPLLIMLDGINDPHNLGAILRSADAFGADGIIVKKHGQAPLNATVAKVSTGAIDFIPVCQVTNLTQTINELKKNGYWVVSSDGSAKMDLNDIDYKFPTVLVVGSEGEGISRLILENSDYITKINMVGHVNSLNASVACAIYLSTIHYKRFL